VQHGLAIEEQEEDAANKSSGLRNMSEDMKRTLGALHVRDYVCVCGCVGMMAACA